MSNQSEFLREMAKMVILTGRLTDVHVENLKYFPMIYFNSVQEISLDYSISTTHDIPSLIIYKLKLDGPMNDQVERRFSALEKAVRLLFWNDTQIEVYFNGESVYKTEKNL